MLASLNLLNTINNVSFCCSLKVPYYAKSLDQYFTITVICVFILSEVHKKSLCFLYFLCPAQHVALNRQLWKSSLSDVTKDTAGWCLLRPLGLCHGHRILAPFKECNTETDGSGLFFFFSSNDDVGLLHCSWWWRTKEKTKMVENRRFKKKPLIYATRQQCM